MLDLTGLVPSKFDAVICMDNAFPHLENSEQLIQAAVQCRSKLASQWVVHGQHPQLRSLDRRRPTVQGPFFDSDQGQRRIVFQVWDWLDERRYIFHLHITRMVENEWQTFMPPRSIARY